MEVFKNNLKNKNWLLLLFASLLLLIWTIIPSRAFAIFRAGELSLHVDDNSLEVGDTLSGWVEAKVNAPPGEPPRERNCTVEVYFDIAAAGGNPDIEFECNYDPSTGAENFVVCKKNFYHVYLTPGWRFVTTQLICDGRFICGKSRRISVTTSTRPVFPTGLATPITSTTIEEIIRRVTNIIYWLFASVAIIFILIGGMQILTSAGVPAQIAKGRRTITYALLGLGILTLARGIILLIYLVLPLRNR